MSSGSHPEKLLKLSTFEVGALHSTAFRAMSNHLNARLAPYRLTASEWSILGGLYKHGEMLPSELSTLLGVSRPFTARLLGELAERDLVAREGGENDRRSVSACLTPAGRSLVENIEREMRVSLREYLGDIPRDQLATYLHVLTLLAKKDGQVQS